MPGLDTVTQEQQEYKNEINRMSDHEFGLLTDNEQWEEYERVVRLIRIQEKLQFSLEKEFIAAVQKM